MKAAYPVTDASDISPFPRLPFFALLVRVVGDEARRFSAGSPLDGSGCVYSAMAR